MKKRKQYAGISGSSGRARLSLVCAAAAGIAVVAVLAGCKQAPDQNSSPEYKAELTGSGAVYLFTGTGAVPTADLQVTLRNTGNASFERLDIDLTGLSDEDILNELVTLDKTSVTNFAAGAEEALKVSFSDEIGAGWFAGESSKTLGLEVYINGKRSQGAIATFTITCTPFEGTANDDLLTLAGEADPLLQMGELPDPLTAATTNEARGASPWISTDSSVAVVAEDGTITVLKDGTTFIGYVAVIGGSTVISGKAVTVYPAAQTLNPVYGDGYEADLDSTDFTLNVSNADAINTAKGDDTLTFTHDEAADNGDDIIQSFDDETGSFVIKSETPVGNEVEVTVTLAITKIVTQGTLKLYTGTTTFTIRVVAAAAPHFESAATVHEISAVTAVKVKATFDNGPALSAGGGDAKDGWTISAGTVDAEVSITISSAQITEARYIEFTLAEPIQVGDSVKIAYDDTLGSITRSGIALVSFGPEAVTNTLVAGPAITNAQIIGDPRAMAKTLRVTFDKAATVPNADGFVISDSGSGSSFTLAYASGSGTTLVTFTLNREPSWAEIDADALAVVYDGTGNVTDSAGRPCAAGSQAITLTSFSADEYQPPALAAGTPIEIDYTAPAQLVVTWTKALNVATGAGGFTLASPTNITILGASVSGTALTLTLSRSVYVTEAEAGGFTLTYTPANGAVNDLKGNTASGFTGETVTITNAAGFPLVPALVFTRAATVLDAPSNTSVTRVDALFSHSLALKSAKEAKDGFTIKANASPLGIAGAVFATTNISNDSIHFTLSNPINAGDTVTIEYDDDAGGIERTGTSALPYAALASFGPESVTNTLISAPAIVSVVLDGNYGPGDPLTKTITVTYDKPFVEAAVDGTGFSLSNNAGSLGLTFGEASEELKTITFTLNRDPTWAEIDAAVLTLNYDGDAGKVKDADERKAASASKLVEFENFDNAVYGPPVLESADPIVLDGNDPTHITITFDREIADETVAAGGFTLDAGTTGITITEAVVNGSTLVLELSRAPSKPEVEETAFTVAYSGADVKGVNGIAVDAFGATAVTERNTDQFQSVPVLLTAQITRAVSPLQVVLTFDRAVRTSEVNGHEGFSISGSATATSFTGVTGNGTTTLTLTLNRKPAYSEKDALRLSYNKTSGHVVNDVNNSLVLDTFSDTDIENDLDASLDSRPEVTSIVIDGTGAPGSWDNAKKVLVTYDKNVTIVSESGFTISGSSTAGLILSASYSGKVVTLNLDNPPSYNETVKLSYNMNLGNVKDAADETNLVLGFDNQTVDLQNYGSSVFIDTVKPRVTSAEVLDSAKDKLRLVFSEPVTITPGYWRVQVNVFPATALGSISSGNTLPVLDLNKKETRTVTSATAVETTNDTTWDLTMSAAATHGEILRFSTTTEGGAQDKAAVPNTLPVIPEYIIKNSVKRVRNGYESTPGFYWNGVLQEGTAVDADLYTHAVLSLENTGVTDTTSYLNDEAAPGTKLEAGDVVIIVMDRDQNGGRGPWDSYKYGTKLLGNANGATVILTTPVGTNYDVHINQTSDYAVFYPRNSIRLIVEEHVIIQNAGNRNTALIVPGDGGVLILEGKILGNGYQVTGTKGAGAIAGGGGNFGMFTVINGIVQGHYMNSSNVNNTNNNSGAGGAIFIDQYGVVVMYGGEISTNTLNMTAAPTFPLAAAINSTQLATGQGNTNKYHGISSFYMIDGEIKNNQVIASAAEVASAGGVQVSGSFQKFGGTIYGADADNSLSNKTSTNLTGQKAAAAIVLRTTGINPGTVSKRNNTSGPLVPLVVTSYKQGDGAIATSNPAPTWTDSYWD
jgi:hypothetical protein